MAIFLGLVLAQLVLFWGLAQLQYDGYTVLRDHISNQGGWAANPTGWYFFTIGTIVAGTCLIPLFLFLDRRLAATWRGRWGRALSALTTLALITGSVGFVLVGIFPQDIQAPHDLAAGIAFGGLGAGAFLSFLLLLRNLLARARPDLRWPPAFLVFHLAALAVSAFFILQWDAFSDSLVQWANFGAVLLWVVGTFLTAPALGVEEIETLGSRAEAGRGGNQGPDVAPDRTPERADARGQYEDDDPE